MKDNTCVFVPDTTTHQHTTHPLPHTAQRHHTHPPFPSPYPTTPDTPTRLFNSLIHPITLTLHLPHPTSSYLLPHDSRNHTDRRACFIPSHPLPHHFIHSPLTGTSSDTKNLRQRQQ
ncbi:hypothetical protein BU24DRAFT_281536 [Aaosphaeria arxii CBS 175.79]|uniref:Uncharacterized protein n=1 Tax=Aaosphaeria arxii CBS 175.79 TaxID=1450172 RepID=A0A6A5XF32_9PLEO|nr:uncharacterized protein BU24DRAFT_281536 [Aaosphaeria arxii CBS 175.79]KAF2011461.1 hypothetical protein BU24DRAFT_281536 [Aaosphaeria arxii CBS 175.79]